MCVCATDVSDTSPKVMHRGIPIECRLPAWPQAAASRASSAEWQEQHQKSQNTDLARTSKERQRRVYPALQPTSFKLQSLPRRKNPAIG
mmetsp:Transcript_7733/g.15635  ORF Transcript_7733/g.15635 Transcript_7733/m.15635 type:complete len:89 (-) Transcript_7733:740-1006(-)